MRSINSLVRPLAPSFCLTLVSSCAIVAALPTHAQAQDLTPLQIDAEIDYARGLARSWQFLDLSQNVLNGLAGRNLSGNQLEALELARCEVFASGARTIGDDSLREGLFDQALDGYRAFLDSYPRSTLLPTARRDYIGVATDYATHMAGMLEEAAGDESKRISAAMDQRLTAVLSDSADAISDLERISERTESQDRQFWSMRLDRGRLLLRLGRATRSGETYLNLAESEMIAAATQAPIDSSFEQQAYIVLGEVYFALGQVKRAADSFEYVAESFIPRDRQAWLSLKEDLEPQQIQYRWLYLEVVTPLLIDAHLATGRIANAVNAGLHLFNCSNGDRLAFTPSGHLAAVATARSLFEAGGWVGGTAGNANYRWFQTVEDADAAGFNARARRPALEFALTVALDMAENGVGLARSRAKALIGDLIESPGVVFGPDVLFEAARGSYESGEYTLATSAFRRVVDAVASNEVEARLWGGKVSWYLGECFRRQDRHLEAAMAYHHGVTRWRGDAEYDARNAQAGYSAIGRAMRADPEAPAFVALRDELGTILRSMPDAGADVAFEFARRKFDQARGESNEQRARVAFNEAVKLYEEVPLDSPNYGTARARIGVSHYLARNASAAQEAFEEFENDRAGASDSTMRNRFDGALAEVRYYQGQLALDAQDYGRAFEIYSQYPAQFPSERDKHAGVLALAVNAAVAMGRDETALELTRRMANEYPDAQQTLSAAAAVFTPLYAEYQATEAGSAERKEVVPTLIEIVALRNKLTTQPTYQLLRLESTLYLEDGRFEAALAILERINKMFADSTDAAMQRNLRTFVQPDLGIVLLELGRLPEAHAILAPLVPAADATTGRPTLPVVEAYIKSVIGWPKGDPSRPEVLPGVGGAAEVQKAFEWALKLTAQVERTGRNTPEWFEARFVELWALYQWGRLDSEKMASLRGILASIKGDVGDSEFENLTKVLGADPSLAARFRWLDRLPK